MKLDYSCRVAFIALLLSAAFFTLREGQASEDQGIEFEIIALGDLSGYQNETYLVVRAEAELAEVWEKHTTPYFPELPYPEIDFSEKVLVCAFMGRRPTAGYSISAEKIWADEEKIHVEITKRSPSENLVVSQVITQPYVFVSIERVDMEIVIHVTEENGNIKKYILPEFSTTMLVLIMFVGLSAAIVLIKNRAQGNKPGRA